MKNSFYILLSAFFLFSSCETEVDLFGEYEKTPVVFALLEPANPVQYFRINPTFIGDGDARQVASDAAITNYAAGELEVKLIDITSSVPIEYVLKESDTIMDLDGDGIFDGRNRIYYLRTDTTVETAIGGQIVSVENEVLIPCHTYRLEIYNTITKTRASSEITLGNVNLLRMQSPQIGLSQFSRNWLPFYTGTNYNENFKFEFDVDFFSERYQLAARFYYTGPNVEGDTFPYSKNEYEDFVIGETNGVEATSSSCEAPKRISIDFDGERFYSIMATRLTSAADRTGHSFDFIITAVGEDLDTYVSVQNATLSGLSQEKPSYSNINGGLGIFSFRLKRTFIEFKLNESSALHLREGDYTRNLFKCARFGTGSNPKGVVRCD